MLHRRRNIKARTLQIVMLVLIVALMVLMVLTGCERRELYVYGSEFHSLSLKVDWGQYSAQDPDGMTAWFWPSEQQREPYRFTTSSVKHYDLYLAGGTYDGIVIDYSPEEYSRQVFAGMDQAATARIEAAPDAHQPETLEELYGKAAYGRELPEVLANGLYALACQPEPMGLDTLPRCNVTNGEYGDYIPYEQRDSYQESLVVKELRATPLTVVETMTVKVAVRGINNLWQVTGSIAGLANGQYLLTRRNTDVPCLIAVDEWTVTTTDHEGNGYISADISTFGLRPSSIEGYDGTRAHSDHDADGDGYVDSQPRELRLNLHFTLRDRKTILNYHIDVGHHVVEAGSEKLLLVNLDAEFQSDDPIVLPYVEPYDGTGFGADVDPWQDAAEDADVQL